jgi:hypothetical protein
MIKRINNILKSIILSWVIMFGVISNHPECKTLISDICQQKKLSFSIQQISVFPADILALNPMSRCREDSCCEEQGCEDEKKVIFSGQYPNKIKPAWGIENKILFTNHKTKKLYDGSYQNKIPKTNSIYIFTQVFLC